LINSDELKSLADTERHSILAKAFTCILYATSIKDLKAYAVNFTDLLVLCMALHSAHHSSTSRSGSSAFESKSNLDVIQIASEQDKLLLKVDFKIIVDALYDTLTHDDNECWGIAKRIIIHTIDLSEVISKQMRQRDPASPNDLTNVELLGYMVEKLTNLCFERSWWSKRVG
jgi:hypothetical protein